MKRFLLLACALLAAPAQAYEILESKYHVETSPGKFEDQLVLRCDDGRKVTVSWEARLSAVCGEVEYSSDSTVGGTPVAAGQDKQKEDVIARVREQPGGINERHLQFQPGADGMDVQFSPQTREILKRYEVCRKQTKGSPVCAAERDQALAALSAPGTSPATATGAAEPAPATKTSTAKRKTSAKRAKPVEPRDAEAIEAAEMPADSQPPMPTMPTDLETAQPGPMDAAPDRVTAEQKIGDAYTVCMRAKPRFECEQARAAALKALDKGKGKGRTQSGKAEHGGKSHSVATN